MTASTDDYQLSLAQDLAETIRTGTIDSHLQLVKRALVERERAVTLARTKMFSVGDVVQFVGQISPRYLLGQTATIVPSSNWSGKQKPGTVIVRCPSGSSYRKFAGLTVQVPVNAIKTTRTP